MKKAICIMSGGLDSTLCAVMAKNMNYQIIGLHFDYGQKTMKKEREAFNKICDFLEIKQKINLNVDFIAKIASSSLTSSEILINKNGVQKNKIPTSYVPYRNGIFLSIATALAEKNEAESIFIGVVQEDSSGYPDCKVDFIKSYQESINLGTAIKNKIQIITPLINLNKKEIVEKSMELNSPIDLTWSCYGQEELACGLCDSCRLRLKGFKEAKEKDKIKYASVTKH